MTHYISFTIAASLYDGELYWQEMQLPFSEHETSQAMDSIYAMFAAGYITSEEMKELQARVFHVSVNADLRRI